MTTRIADEINEEVSEEAVDVVDVTDELAEDAATAEAASNVPQPGERGYKSYMIRKLNQEGWTNSEIAKVLQIRYQHVYNTLHAIPGEGVDAEGAKLKLEARIAKRQAELDKLMQKLNGRS
jgi:hypothetical protein